MTRAFVASADLKVMARQLEENRTPAAYAGVEEYARRHAGSDAGALAWLAVGYSRYLDQQYAQAIGALEMARPQAGELTDYVQYLEAVCYAGQGNSAKVVELLRDFDGQMPESIFQNEVVDVYGNALTSLGQDAGGDCLPGGAPPAGEGTGGTGAGKKLSAFRASRKRHGDSEASVLHHADQVPRRTEAAVLLTGGRLRT